MYVLFALHSVIFSRISSRSFTSSRFDVVVVADVDDNDERNAARGNAHVHCLPGLPGIQYSLRRRLTWINVFTIWRRCARILEKERDFSPEWWFQESVFARTLTRLCLCLCLPPTQRANYRSEERVRSFLLCAQTYLSFLLSYFFHFSSLFLFFLIRFISALPHWTTSKPASFISNGSYRDACPPVCNVNNSLYLFIAHESIICEDNCVGLIPLLQEFNVTRARLFRRCQAALIDFIESTNYCTRSLLLD